MQLGIVQCRSGSKRFPKKCFEEINGISLVDHAYQSARRIMPSVVAIPSNDDILANHLSSLNIPHYLGDENDVLSRYHDCANAYGATRIMRITADCPAIPDCVLFQAANTRAEVVTNVWPNRTYPDGWDVEIFSMRVLKWLYENAEDKEDREHVTSYMYSHMKQMEKELKGVSVITFHLPLNLSHIKWSIDTEEDLNIVRKLMSK